MDKEERRIRDLFKRVKKEIEKPELDAAELEIINPEKTDENYFKNEMAARIKKELLPDKKVMALNMVQTKTKSDMGIAGLIAHEFAHIFEGTEEGADKLAASWGFEQEIKVLNAELMGFNKAGLTIPEYYRLITAWKPPKLRVSRRRKGCEK